MLRRLRYDLYARVLRFPLPHFRKLSHGEIITMITAELEPLGGFIGDAFSLPAFQGGTLLVILGFLFVQNPLMAAAAGSTSRGTAMSITSKGRPPRSAMILSNSSQSITSEVAAVEVNSTSASTSSAPSSSRCTARAPSRSANSCARPHERLASTNSASRTGAMALAIPPPISPAPSTTIRRPAKPERCADAIATAASDTDVRERPSRVSDRTRLPTPSA